MNKNRAKGKNDFSDLYFQDHLNEPDKKTISGLYGKKESNVQDILQGFFDKGLSVKISWSDYNEAHVCMVSPTDRDHPSFKTYYSTFHKDWQKAVFICDYLLKDRYDYGDWTKGGGTVHDNSW